MKNWKSIRIEKGIHKKIKALADYRKMKLEGLIEILLIKALEVFK